MENFFIYMYNYYILIDLSMRNRDRERSLASGGRGPDPLAYQIIQHRSLHISSRKFLREPARNPLFDTTHYPLFDLRVHLPDVFTLTFPWLSYIHLVETNRKF